MGAYIRDTTIYPGRTTHQNSDRLTIRLSKRHRFRTIRHGAPFRRQSERASQIVPDRKLPAGLVGARERTVPAPIPRSAGRGSPHDPPAQRRQVGASWPLRGVQARERVFPAYEMSSFRCSTGSRPTPLLLGENSPTERPSVSMRTPPRECPPGLRLACRLPLRPAERLAAAGPSAGAPVAEASSSLSLVAAQPPAPRRGAGKERLRGPLEGAAAVQQQPGYQSRPRPLTPAAPKVPRSAAAPLGGRRIAGWPGADWPRSTKTARSPGAPGRFVPADRSCRPPLARITAGLAPSATHALGLGLVGVALLRDLSGDPRGPPPRLSPNKVGRAAKHHPRGAGEAGRREAPFRSLRLVSLTSTGLGLCHQPRSSGSERGK